MITFIQGTLEENWPGLVVVNANGVGYKIVVPLAGDEAFGQMGKVTKVLTYLHVREQEQTLFGFPDKDSRDLFRLLLDRVSGVGPKVAMSILSGMNTNDFKQAVVSGDIDTISKIKGIGKKTAERVVLELRDKVGLKEAWETQQTDPANISPRQKSQNDALLALISLGYKQNDARKAISKVSAEISAPDEILRAALRLLQQG